VSDPDVDSEMATANKFAREHGGAEGQVGQIGDMEGGAIAAGDPHRRQFCAGTAGEANLTFIP
jgi:hypothetical protein